MSHPRYQNKMLRGDVMENEVGRVEFEANKPLWFRVEDLEEEIQKLKEENVWMFRELKKFQEYTLDLQKALLEVSKGCPKRQKT